MIISNNRKFRSRKLLAVFSVLMAVSLACNLPFLPTPAPGPGEATISPEQKSISREQLPPVVVETSPLPSETIPLTGAITLTFDQPMDRSSVEGAVKVDPAVPGRFEWQGDATVQFVPDQPLSPETQLTITIGETARSSEGLNLLRASSFSFQTSGGLQVVEKLPQPGTIDANPSSTVAVTFNQPVVPLGESNATPAFSLEPEVDGKGFWLNTSTYVFEPDPSMGGGVQYSVHIDPELKSLAGVALDQEISPDWTFTTARPVLLEVLPAVSTTIMLDEEFQLTFNQPMDTASVEENFSLQDAARNEVEGEFTWSNRDTVVTFSPSQLFPRGNAYTLRLARQAKSRGGTSLLISSSTTYRSVGEFGVNSTKPAQGEPFKYYASYGSIVVNFNAPLAEGQDLSQLVQIVPLPGSFSINPTSDRKAIYISGTYEEATNYLVTVDGDLQDRWGGSLGESFKANFLVSDSVPVLEIPTLAYYDRILFAEPGDSTLPAYATNLSTINLSRAELNLQQFLDVVFKYDSARVEMFPDLEKWEQTIALPLNLNQGIDIDLVPGDDELAGGIYLYRINSPDLPARTEDIDFLLASAQVQITIKESQEEVFVWVTNLKTGQPVADAEVQIYTSAGEPAAVGITASDGTARIPLVKEDPYQDLVAVTGTPGNADFGVGSSTWTRGISPWTMGVRTRTSQPELKGYLYTDRPIYRPGQTIYFHSVLRTQGDARYTPAPFDSATFLLYGIESMPYVGDMPLLDSVTLELSPYGTASGEFKLPEDAPPGHYSIQIENQEIRLAFQVAEYRKPEIDVQVDFTQTDYRAGQDVEVSIEADYYFGGAVSDARVRWTLYREDKYFHIPGGYATGLIDTSWLYPSWYGRMEFFGMSYVASGEGVTGPDGTLDLVFTDTELAESLDPAEPHTLSLQAELVDESGQTVSKRGSIILHPDDFYIGIKPESWTSRAGDTMGFTLQTTDWDAKPLSEKSLSAVFQKVEWVQDWSNIKTGEVTYREQLTEIGSVNLQTDANGIARIEFAVDEPGAYRLDVQGGQAASQVLLWVGGAGSVPWPNLPDQHIRLQSDQENYQPGDSAQIFIPNPFGQGAAALVTVERRGVLRSQVIELTDSSKSVELDILIEDAPNVFVSVLVVGRNTSDQPDFRIGYLELEVDARALVLDVDLSLEDTTLNPGETARVDIQVRDSGGNPVQGEFTMAVVDKAIFALADPNAPDIITAFYGPQPLGVRTSTPFTAYTNRFVTTEPAVGGAGGGDMFAPVAELREDFRDTAYWSGSFETDNAGKAMIEIPMPDNLTTWVVTVRGLTRDTRVGEAVTELTVTKDLIIRPVTPRFMVAGDRIQLGAVVNNNTQQTLDVTVELQAVGVTLSAGDAALAIQVPANGRRRVNWWVDVQDAGEARLVFSARSGSLQDASTPPMGDIPILRYSSPQTFATGGLMTSAGEFLEVVSLPASYQPTGGELRVEMNSSLAGTVISGLEVMESYSFDFTEPILSHLLANLAGYNLLKESGSGETDLTARYQKAIREDLDRLPGLQNTNGGFGWSRAGKSDLYLSSYALLALTWAREAGFMVQPNLKPTTQEYVRLNLGSIESAREPWQLDRLALAYYALDQAGVSGTEPELLYPQRERLSSWSKALLALALEEHDEQMSKTLISDLQGSAIRSATGVNWQDEDPAWENFVTPTFNTAVVVYALSTQDPASPLLADAVRYLVSHRQATGGWYSSYDTAWVLTALTQYVSATSELKGAFDYSAVLNGAPIASGSAGSAEPWSLVRAGVPLSELDDVNSNSLRFIRGEGAGRLYYRAYLEIGQPVEKAKPLDRGLTVSRDYILAGADCKPQDCPAVESVNLQARNPVVVGRVTITNPTDLYYVVVEDAIPAGTEIINLQLKTSSFVFENQSIDREIDAMEPFESGWGWWYFGSPSIYDDRIQWVASYLPAGTYTLTYQLQPLLAGEFRVMPARAYTYYFPEVEGRSAGMIFTIKE